MEPLNHDILRRLRRLIRKTQRLIPGSAPQTQSDLTYALKCFTRLADCILQDKTIFTIEPWHDLGPHQTTNLPVPPAGEMLLRLKERSGKPLAPYPFIMACYNNGLGPALDAVLVLCALGQFERRRSVLPERFISVNVCAPSLANGDFIRAVLPRIEAMELSTDEAIIFEIHESTGNVRLSRPILNRFRLHGVRFAIDDVGLSIRDVFRLGEFEGIAEYVKLDRSSVCAHPDQGNSLDHVMEFVMSSLPDAVIVAEGVRSAAHARELRAYHPSIRFVQGMRLPDRRTFDHNMQLLEKEARRRLA